MTEIDGTKLATDTPSTQNLASLFPFSLERATKAIALLAVTCYILGYLILTLNDTAHGFLETGLIKPRAIAVGAAFTLLVVLPLSVSTNSFFLRKIDIETFFQTLLRNFLGTVAVLTACFVSSALLIGFFADTYTGLPVAGAEQGAFLILFWAVPLYLLFRSRLRENYYLYPKTWLALGLLSLAAVGFASYILRSFGVMRYAVWTLVFVVIVEAVRSDVKRNIRVKLSFVPLLVSVVGLLSTYTLVVFPYLKPALGGGYPMRATVFLSKDSPIHAGETVRASLLEASDSGFYFAFEGEKGVTYIPASLVRALEYSSTSK